MTERETIINGMADDKTYSIYSSEYKWINKILVLSKRFPSQVIIERIDFLDENDTKPFSIQAVIPKKYLKITPPRKMTEEQRIAASKRMKEWHKRKNNGT